MVLEDWFEQIFDELYKKGYNSTLKNQNQTNGSSLILQISVALSSNGWVKKVFKQVAP